MDENVNLQKLKDQVQVFCEDRDWDQYHGPKELAIGAITEAAELLEHFRFQNEEQIMLILENPEKREELGEELSDILFFILRFSQLYNFDLTNCFQKKMEKNSIKYPVAEFFGQNHKSTIADSKI